MKPIILRSLPLLLVALSAACGGDPSDGTAPPQAAPEAVPVATGDNEAKQLFESLCFTCHGLTGQGDGPGAVAFNPKPRAFSDLAWQDSVTDDHIKKVIVYGGAAVGKSPMMIGQPQLKGNESVLDGLVKIVRGFRAK